jgi:hypothetical protein
LNAPSARSYPSLPHGDPITGPAHIIHLYLRARAEKQVSPGPPPRHDLRPRPLSLTALPNASSRLHTHHTVKTTDPENNPTRRLRWALPDCPCRRDQTTTCARPRLQSLSERATRKHQHDACDGPCQTPNRHGHHLRWALPDTNPPRASPAGETKRRRVHDHAYSLAVKRADKHANTNTTPAMGLARHQTATDITCRREDNDDVCTTTPTAFP